MTLSDLIEQARIRADDTVSTAYLWTDAEWKRYANEAEREACRRARLIVDSTTVSVCRVTLAAGTKTYSLDPRVIFIRRAKLSGVAVPLRRVSYRDLDRSVPGWEDETGEPMAHVPDMDTGKFRPYPAPTAAGTVTLTVVRLPLCDMVQDEDEPEINDRYHESLIHWMLYRAYSKQDAETKDAQKAAENLALFEQEFGKKSSAIDEEWIEREHGYTDEEGVF